MLPKDFIFPDWPSLPHVKACVTTRMGGVSTGPYTSLNLGSYTEDPIQNVQKNRDLLKKALDLPSEPCWLKQVHGKLVICAEKLYNNAPEADASMTRKPGTVCVVQTADCLPVLFANKQGTCVAAAHAGWKGLLAGVLQATVRAMELSGGDILAWLGPAIGPQAFEVDEIIRALFIKRISGAEVAFKPAKSGTWLADLYLLGRLAMRSVGVTQVFGGGFCTVQDPRFFSHRRDKGVTGRMAGLIWIK